MRDEQKSQMSFRARIDPGANSRNRPQEFGTTTRARHSFDGRPQLIKGGQRRLAVSEQNPAGDKVVADRDEVLPAQNDGEVQPRLHGIGNGQSGSSPQSPAQDEPVTGDAADAGRMLPRRNRDV